MKVKVIKTYDHGDYSKKIENLYETTNVLRVEPSVVVFNSLIWYIAICFYEEYEV